MGRTFWRAAGVLRGATGLLGAPLRGHGAVVLTYHDVIDAPVARADEVSVETLRADLEAVRRWGLRFVDLTELVARVEAGQPIDGLAAVTFDDALVGIHRVALPLLQELRVPATVFAVSCRLAVRDAEWRPGSQRLMSADELVDVADAGVGVQSHSRTHADLTAIAGDGRALHDELAGSRQDLEQILGRPVEQLAYPFGYFDRRVCTAAAEAGYRAAFTVLPARIRTDHDRFRLPRFQMAVTHRRTRLAYMLARPASSFRDPQPDAMYA